MAFIKMKILEQEFREWDTPGKTEVKQDKFINLYPRQELF